MTTETTALILPTPTDLAALFKQPEGMEGIIAKLEAAARSEVAGLTTDTAKGRDAIKSLAHKVSQSKAELDRQGKALTEQQRKEIDAVNSGRRIAEARLSALRDEIRKPVTEWEAADDARKQRIGIVLAGLRNPIFADDPSSADIKARADEITALDFTDFAEFTDQANMLRETALASLRTMYSAAVTREIEAKELAYLRAEKAAREAAEAERLERERIAAEEAAAEAQRQRDEQRRKEEAEARAREIEAQRQAAAEQARIDAENAAKAEAERIMREAADRAAQAKLEAEEREAALQAQIEAQRRETEAAAQRERDRIEAERQAAEVARQKREADAAHRARIKAAIVAALDAMRGNASPDQIADALMAGQIPHCKVEI